MRALILVSIALSSCAPSARRSTPSAATDPSRGIRVLLEASAVERAVRPFACYDVRRAAFIPCPMLLHPGDVVTTGDALVTLGLWAQYRTYGCAPDSGFDVPTDMPENARYAVWPAHADYDVRPVPQSRGPVAVDLETRADLAALAERFRERACGALSDEERAVGPDDVTVEERVVEDMDEDGSADGLYLFSVDLSAYARCGDVLRSTDWYAIAMELVAARRTVLLADTTGGFFRIDATFELDGSPPRELRYTQWTGDAPVARAAYIEDDTLVPMFTPPCEE